MKHKLNGFKKQAKESYKAKLHRDKLLKVLGKKEEVKVIKYYCHGTGNN